jgi:hypothetical protein
MIRFIPYKDGTFGTLLYDLITSHTRTSLIARIVIDLNCKTLLYHHISVKFTNEIWDRTETVNGGMRAWKKLALKHSFPLPENYILNEFFGTDWSFGNQRFKKYHIKLIRKSERQVDQLECRLPYDIRATIYNNLVPLTWNHIPEVCQAQKLMLERALEKQQV